MENKKITSASSALETIEALKRQVAAGDTPDIKKMAEALKGSTARITCENIIVFTRTMIQYKRNPPGVEILRTPGRLWNDRKTGGDLCDHIIFVSAILKQLNIPFLYRLCHIYDREHPTYLYLVITGEDKQQFSLHVLEKNPFKDPDAITATKDIDS